MGETLSRYSIVMAKLQREKLQRAHSRIKPPATAKSSAGSTLFAITFQLHANAATGAAVTEQSFPKPKYYAVGSTVSTTLSTTFKPTTSKCTATATTADALI